MIKSNFIQLIRSLRKEKTFAIFNIGGLGLGMACCILIVLYVSNILRYEKHHVNADRLYLYGVNMTIGGISSTQSSCNPSVGPLLQNYMPGIESFVRTQYLTQADIEIGNKSYLADEEMIWADETIFSVFTHEFVHGSAKNSTNNPNAIVLSESMARKYFNDENPIGQLIRFKDYDTYEVTGVIKDPPKTSHLSYSAILPLSSLLRLRNQDYAPSPDRMGGGMSFETYFLFHEGFGPVDFYSYFKSFYEDHLKASDNINYKAVIDPIADIYLNSKIWNRYSQGNKRVFYGFISIAVFMLILASINYINLSTARAESRAREVGVKKVLGAGKTSLIVQFMNEAWFYSIASMFTGILIAHLILLYTPFNELIGQDLSIRTLYSPRSGTLLVGITLLIGFLSGIYPAFFLSGILPLKALSGRFRVSYGRFTFRNVLVTTQFVVSISAIVLSMLMNNQLKFMFNKDLGFEDENILVLNIKNESAKNKVVAFRNTLLSNPSIESASFSNFTPGFPNWGMAYRWEQEDGTMGIMAAVPFEVDVDYFRTLGLEIVDGQGFKEKRMPGDSLQDIIVNEQFVNKMGWTEPVGKRSSFGKVIGVVKDFNFSSLRTEIRPSYLIQYDPERVPDLLNLKVSGHDLSETLKFIETSWNREFSDIMFDLEFMDQKLHSLYEENQNQIALNNAFSLISILISCIGLVGLITFITGKRIREIALRKVFGARDLQLFRQLFAGIFYQILIASFIAFYFGLQVYNNWIEGFVYRVPMRYSVFLVSLVVVLTGSIIISFYYAQKVISRNPADTLKYE